MTNIDNPNCITRVFFRSTQIEPNDMEGIVRSLVREIMPMSVQLSMSTYHSKEKGGDPDASGYIAIFAIVTGMINKFSNEV